MSTVQKLSIAAERALKQEAHLCKRLIETGLTVLRKANSDNPGTYYQSFFELSTAIERLGKLVLALDYYYTNGRFPSDKFFRGATKSSEGHHNLASLMKKVELINLNRSLGVENLLTENSSESIVLDFLSDFANTERYYNLKSLNAKVESIDDPVAIWVRLIIQLIPEKLMVLTKNEIQDICIAHYMDQSDFLMLIRLEAESGTHITDMLSDAKNDMLMSRANQEGVILCIHIFRYLSEILSHVTALLHKQRSQVPYFDEFFYMWANSDSYLRKRRDFTR